MSRFYNAFFLNGNFSVELYVKPGLTANYAFVLPNVAPTDGQYLRWNNTAGSLEWGIPAVGGGGTVSSVAASFPTAIFDVTVVNPTTTPSINVTLDNQAANTVFSAPNGASGQPTFRTLVNADIPVGIDAAKISGVLAKANMPNGTQATSWQIGTGVTLVDDSGSLKITGSDGTTVTDLTVRNINVTGNIDTVSSTNTLIGDSAIFLLGNYTGSTPNTNASYSVERGTLTNASVRWNATTLQWEIGLDDNLIAVSRTSSVQITNANISGGSYVFTHNLRASGKDPVIVVKDNNNRQIMMNVTFTSADSVTVDFSRVGILSGTWQITAEV